MAQFVFGSAFGSFALDILQFADLLVFDRHFWVSYAEIFFFAI
jgi:hypothetical protein